MSYVKHNTVVGGAKLVGGALALISLLMGLGNARAVTGTESQQRRPWLNEPLSDLASGIDQRLFVETEAGQHSLVAIHGGTRIPIGPLEAHTPSTSGHADDGMVQAMLDAVSRQVGILSRANPADVAGQLDEIAGHWAVWSRPTEVVVAVDPRLVVKPGTPVLNMGAQLIGRRGDAEHVLTESFDISNITHATVKQAEEALRQLVRHLIHGRAVRVNRDELVLLPTKKQVTAILDHKAFHTAHALSRIASDIDPTLSVKTMALGQFELIRTLGGRAKNLGPIPPPHRLSGAFTPERAAREYKSTIRDMGRH